LSTGSSNPLRREACWNRSSSGGRGAGYELIAGHRFEAARNCGHQTIRAKVYDSLSDDEAELIQIDENLIRANLSDDSRRSSIPKKRVKSRFGSWSTPSLLSWASHHRRPPHQHRQPFGQ